MNSYEPLVSIIIPVYNGTNYMREAIDSALAQTYKNIEIIVVNDGSTDDNKTDEVAKSYGSKIRYFVKQNGGCASALNYGISKMKGEWFSWLSHDDKYYPEKIKKSVDFICKNNLQNGNTLVYCDSDLMDDKGATIFHPVTFNSGFFDDLELLKGLLFDFSVNGCALLIHKRVLNEIGEFDQELKYTPDFDYWIRVALAGYGMAAFDEKLCSNRVHARQVSVQAKARMRPDIAKQLRKINSTLECKTNKCKFLENVWIYAYSRGYAEEAALLWDSMKKQNMDLAVIKKTGRIYRIKYMLEKKVKEVYRFVFKKGMD